MERTGFEQWKPREVARLLALVETERRYYQEMVAALPVALAVLSPDRAIVSSNTAFRRLVNLSGEDLRQKHIEQILPSDELIERIRASHVSGDRGFFSIGMGERRFRMAALPIRSWEDEMQPETLLLVEPAAEIPAGPAAPAVPGVQPAPLAQPAPASDLSGIPAALWQGRQDEASGFAFTYVGGAAADLLGYPAAHWIAEPAFFFDRIHPADRAEVLQLYESIAAEGGTASAEFRAINAAGEAVWQRETIAIPPPGEGPRRIFGIMTAIGERRRLEAQAMEAARVDALRSLASRLAHDLNNPLMIISGYSESLLNALPADDPSRGDLKEILAAATRIQDVTGSLLAYTRSQAKPPSKIAVGDVISSIEPRLNEISNDVGIAFPAGSVWTFADPEQLGDALVALAQFALTQFAGASGKASKLRLTCQAVRVLERTGTPTLAPGAYARLEILAPRPLNTQQPAAPPTRVFESIVPSSAVSRAYLNVRQWGGDIAYAIDPERGTSFIVLLPQAPDIEPEIAPQAVSHEETVEPFPVEPEPAPPAPQPEPLLGTILVVEDEPGIRGLVRKILRREHYEVLEAGNGEAALAEAAAQDVFIDLLLTDVILPGMGGRELAESLSSMNPDLKVVYVSGFTDDEGVRAGQFPPGSKFLQKPFTLSALVGAVKEALGQ